MIWGLGKRIESIDRIITTHKKLEALTTLSEKLDQIKEENKRAVAKSTSIIAKAFVEELPKHIKPKLKGALGLRYTPQRIREIMNFARDEYERYKKYIGPYE